jgi:hypothetical protein
MHLTKSEHQDVEYKFYTTTKLDFGDIPSEQFMSVYRRKVDYK